MARVFLPPHYVGADYYATLGWRADDRHVKAAWEGAMDAYYRTSEPGEVDTLDFAAELGKKRGMERLQSWEIASSVIHKITQHKNLHTDQSAMYSLWHKVASGRMTVQYPTSMTKVEGTARACAVAGMVASLASPHLASARSNETKLASDLKREFPRGAGCLAVADALRLGCSTKKTRESFERVIRREGEGDLEDYVIEGSGIDKVLPTGKWYHVGPYVCMLNEDDAYIFSATTRMFTAECLWTAGMWVLAGLNHEDPSAVEASIIGYNYVTDTVGRLLRTPAGPYKLARQMKTSYAICLARYDYRRASEDEKSLIDVQVEALKEETAGYLCGEDPWYNSLARMSDRMAADAGTAWNMLPPPDCDMGLVNSGIKKKLNAPRKVDTPSWDSFIEYSRYAILAHMLVSRPDTEVNWMTQDEPEWAAACREKVLTYPKAEERLEFEVKLPWDKHLETWGYTTQDVTHVYADKKMYDTYESTSATTARGMSELRYYVENGHKFSGKWDPSDVRKGWENGAPLGDRIGYVAAKSENTKPAGQQRETLSADDVLRESLTELDINVSKLSRFINGVVVRAGKVQTEKMIHNVLSKMNQGGLLLSLDVSGWSPNMVRAGEMRFADMLMSFFNIPSKQRASTLFTALNVVIARGGMHDFWRADDGSFQGFFGAVDTMLHSLMAQWAFHEEKEAGRISASAKIDKATVMDDILAAVTGLKITPAEALSSFISQYKRLGFAADAVKTLARSKVGHFLNRLYCNGEEVLTSFKILARADREWDRSWVSIHDETDAIFGSYCGASDRGFSSSRAYVLACWRTMWRLYEADKSIISEGARFELLFAWLPRSLGGTALPTYGSWVNKLGASTLDSAMSAIYVIRDLLRQIGTEGSVATAKTLTTVLKELAYVELSDRTPVSFMDDPLAVRAKNVPDPAAIRRSVAESAISRMSVHPELKQLMAMSRSKEYDEIVLSFLQSAEWSADVASEIASSLPHAIVTVLTEKLASCDKFLRAAGHRVRTKGWKQFVKLNKSATSAWRSLCFSGEVSNADNAIDLCAHLRERLMNQIGVRMANVAAPGALAVVCQVRSEAECTIWVKAPKTSDILSTPKGCTPTVMRSFKAVSARARPSQGARDLGPVAGAFARICAVSSLGHSNGYNASAVDKLWNLLWTGEPDTIGIPKYAVDCANTNRVCSRFEVSTHTVAAHPNYAPHVRVDAHRAIGLLESIPRTFSWLSVVYTLKAAATLDVDLGERDGFARMYGIRAASTMSRSEPDWPVNWKHPDVAIVAPLRESAIMSAYAYSTPKGEDEEEPHDEDARLIIPAAAVDRSRITALERLGMFSAVGIFGIRDAGSMHIEHAAASDADVSSRGNRRENDTGDPDEGCYREVLKAALKGFANGGIEEANRLARGSWNRLFNGRKPENEWHKFGFVNHLMSSNESKFLRALKTARFLLDDEFTGLSRAQRYFGYARRHTIKEQDESLPAWVRYSYHFQAAVMSQFTQPYVNCYVAALSAIVHAVAVGCSSVTGRHMAPKEEEDAMILEVQDDLENVHRVCQHVFKRSMPEDWKDRDDVHRGCIHAVRKCMTYAALDYAVPEVRAAAAPVQVAMHDALASFKSPVLFGGAAPAGTISDDTVREYMLSEGIVMSVEEARELMMDDIREWVKRPEGDSRADV